jgi:hypothetical protein
LGSGDADTDSLLTGENVSNDYEKNEDDGDLRSNAGVVGERGVGGSTLFIRDR